MNTVTLFKILNDHNRWLKTHGKQGARANLSLQNFQGMTFAGLNLTGAVIIGSNFRAADLSCTCLRNAFISYTDLRGASLKKTDFSYAKLINVNVFDDDLSQAILQNTYIPPSTKKFENANERPVNKITCILISGVTSPKK